ncbi:MAG: endolytic transglycosylase MltG [Bacteroidaceae bacterium]|nr:endolytic transglycosylase MltG [Bacteroidaceae bacterium]
MLTKKKYIYILVTIGFLIGLLACAIVGYSFIAITSFNKGLAPFHLYIDKNDSADSVLMKLQPIGGEWEFKALQLLTEYDKYEQKVKTGHYVIHNEESALDIYRILRGGRETPIMLVVPEVRTMNDMALRLSKTLMVDSAELAQCLADSIFCAKFEKTPATISCLFIPNSYEVYWDITPTELLQRMQKESNRFWTEERREQAKALKLSQDEVIILASIVEQETTYAPEKKTVAGMYLNRLRRGMLLQADPTVKFALQDFQLRRILYKHLAVDNPYNTYLNPGLPPGPICVPSIQSIDAVLYAATHNYIYMCAKEDFSGSHNFATNLTQHQRNARRYAAALNAKKIK